MRTQVIECDKCHEKVTDPTKVTTVMLAGARPREPFDLCDGCASTLLEWVAGPVIEQPPFPVDIEQPPFPVDTAPAPAPDES